MASPNSGNASNGRAVLPTNVKPRHYGLTFDLDVNATEYTGQARIEVDVLDNTSSITLNGNGVTVTKALIENASGKSFGDSHVSYNKDTHHITIELASNIEPGSSVTLILDFTAKFQDSMNGLFRKAWTDEQGNKHYQISSHFEPIDARKAFPCFDEPALKATFSVTLIADSNLTCLCNMPIIHSSDIASAKKSITYDKTPLMSTYLLCIIIGELNMIESSPGAFRIPIRLYTTPNNDISTGRFALDVAARSLTLFEEKLGVPFPLPKCDLVTIPDFMGAMEHWGLVTFREDALLWDSKTGTITQKRSLSSTVAHELAHQWFGNLVTMDWWDGLWLNEGFATWAAMYALDELFPEWHERQEFMATDLQEAFNLDSLRNSHPIEADVKNADDIMQLFDAVSYLKGCSVIRMIAATLGEDVFLKGVAAYMEKHRYGSTSTSDLWKALTEVSGQDVEKIMGKWTLHVGHPIVVVTEKEKSIQLEQHRYLRSGDVRADEDEVLYSVPLNLRCEDGQRVDKIFETRELDLAINSGMEKLNVDHVGFYRTAYSSDRLMKMGEKLKKFSAEDRLGILSDAAALAPAGYQSTGDVLSLLQFYRDEDNLVVWKQVIEVFNAIEMAWLFEEESTLQKLQKCQRDIIAPKAHNVGWDLAASKDEDERQLKALLFRTAALADDGKTKKAAADMFDRFKQGDKSAIHTDLKAAVFAIVLTHATDSTEYEVVLEEFRSAKTMGERRVCLTALGNTRQPDQIQRLLALLLTDEVKTQEVLNPLEVLGSHRAGLQACWQWFKSDFADIQAKVNTGISAVFGFLVTACVSNFSSKDVAREVKEFFDHEDSKSFSQSVAQCVDDILVKAHWLERGRKNVQEWLAKRY